MPQTHFRFIHQAAPTARQATYPGPVVASETTAMRHIDKDFQSGYVRLERYDTRKDTWRAIRERPHGSALWTPCSR